MATAILAPGGRPESTKAGTLACAPAPLVFFACFA